MSNDKGQVALQVPFKFTPTTKSDESNQLSLDAGFCRLSRALAKHLELEVVGQDTVLVSHVKGNKPCISVCTIGSTLLEYRKYQTKVVNEAFGLESRDDDEQSEAFFVESIDSLVTLSSETARAMFPALLEYDVMDMDSSVNVMALSPATRIASRVILRIEKSKVEWNSSDIPLWAIGIIQSSLMDVAIMKGCTIHSPGGLRVTFEVEKHWPTSEVVRCGTTTHFSFVDSETEQDETPSIRSIPVLTNNNSSSESDPLSQLRELILWPLKHRDLFERIGSLATPRGILLTGPPGVGKTRSVRIIAEECSQLASVQVQSLQCSQMYQGALGDSEEKLRKVFESARDHAFGAQSSDSNGARVAIIFIDEIDAICPKRSQRAGSNASARIVAQLLTLMDGALSSPRSSPLNTVVVIAATNRPAAIDPALRRPGRFEKEVEVAVPTQQDRARILAQLLAFPGGPSTAALDLPKVAERCVGFVGADLAALAREMVLSCLARQQPEPRFLEADVDRALGKVGEAAVLRSATGNVSRAARREVPYSWADVGGMGAVKDELRIAVEWPLKHREHLERVGLGGQAGARLVGGVLLSGPPGTGKTSLARAAAWASGAAFMTVTSADVYSSAVGEAEETVRKLFAKARAAMPVILFFDEIETIVGKRDLGDGGDGASQVQERILSTFLNELDGVEVTRGGLLVMAATNRPDCIDAALLRPGRFDKQIYVGPPGTNEERQEIFQVHTTRKGMPLADDVDFLALAEQSQGLTGAQISGICKDAAMLSLREALSAGKIMETEAFVQQRHFELAIKGAAEH